MKTQGIHEMLADIRMATLIGVKEMLTIEEAALYLGITANALRVKLSHKELPSYDTGRIYLKKSELNDYMANPDRRRKTIEELIKE